VHIKLSGSGQGVLDCSGHADRFGTTPARHSVSDFVCSSRMESPMKKDIGNAVSAVAIAATG